MFAIVFHHICSICVLGVGDLLSRMAVKLTLDSIWAIDLTRVVPLPFWKMGVSVITFHPLSLVIKQGREAAKLLPEVLQMERRSWLNAAFLLGEGKEKSLEAVAVVLWLMERKELPDDTIRFRKVSTKENCDMIVRELIEALATQ